MAISKKERRKLMKKKLKERAKESTQRGSGRTYFTLPEGVSQFKPDKGDHFIDFVPYLTGSKDPRLPEGEPAYYLEVYVHPPSKGEEGPTRICRERMNVGECPRCDHRKVLQKEGADEDIIRSLVPKRRELYNVLVQDSEAELRKGVQIFDVSYHYMGKPLEPLIKGPMRPGRQDIETYIDVASSEEDGKTIGFQGNMKTIKLPIGGDEITFVELSGHRLLDRDYAIDDDYLDQAVTLDEIIDIPSYEEVYREYWGEDPDESGKIPETKNTDDPDDYRPIKDSRKRAPLQRIRQKPSKEKEPEPEPEPEPNDEINLDAMDKDELIDFMRENGFKIRGYKKMDEDELRFEIEELLED